MELHPCQEPMPVFCECGSPNNHITKLQVFQGDDDYNILSSAEIVGSGDGLKIEFQPSKVTSKYRLRGEPGIVIHFNCESCERIWTKSYMHHKGTVHMENYFPEIVNFSEDTTLP